MEFQLDYVDDMAMQLQPVMNSSPLQRSCIDSHSRVVQTQCSAGAMKL